MKATGAITVTTPVEILSASRGRVIVRLDGVEQVAYVGGTIIVTAEVVIGPRN